MVFLIASYVPMFCKRNIGCEFKLKYKRVIVLGKKEQYGHFEGQ